MTLDLVQRGDKTAQYWAALKQLENDRYLAEEALLEQFYNPRKYPQFYENGRRMLLQEYSKIQNAHSIERNALNKRFAMYQDDVEFEEDNPEKFMLHEWYALFEEATYTTMVNGKLVETDTFDPARLQRLQTAYWKKTLPDGTPYHEYGEFIRRNTVTSKHPPAYRGLLGTQTTARWDAAEKARSEFLKNRGNWSQVISDI